MSGDIRSFFTLKKEKSKKDEDSDVIPGSPDVQITNKKKLLRKKRQIQEDSEDEIFSPPKKKKSSPKASLKEVNVVDLFGKAPIKRSEPIVKKVKKETELTIHSDEEFEQSLLHIDEEINLKIQSTKELEIKIETPALDGHNLYKSPKDTIKLENTPNKKRKLNKSVNEDNVGHTKVVNKKIKKDFSEFVETQHNKSNTKDGEYKPKDDEDKSKEHESEPKQKKRKLENSLNESVLTDEERYERKRQSAALYQKYLNRSGPKHLGTKEIPEGTPNCLKDFSFLLTGVLDSFERDEVIAAVTKYGGSIKNSISKKVTHVIAGDDAGPAKLAKAQELGIKIMNEDEFLQFIKDSSNKKTPPKEIKKENVKKKDKSSEKKKETKPTKKSPQNNNLNDDKIKKEKSPKPFKDFESNSKETDVDRITKEKSQKKIKESENTEEIKKTTNNEKEFASSNREINNENTNSLMWVDKYKPKNLKQIIGQQGEASNVNKLLNWLKKWYVNRKAKLPKPSPWAKNDDGGYYRAVLLSGPPGVGKTTTVSLVCKELGFDTVEFNASDTRSKTLIRDQIGELISSTSLMGYATGSTGKGAVSKKHALVMDEVDGMAGNEDRGGLQELIALIKSTSVPIICMCNDRNSEKMRTLVNYCYDLRFSRPRVEQIKSALMSICFKEGIKLPSEVLSQLVVSSGQDVRQSLHALCVRAARPDALGVHVTKDVKMGPWEAIRKVFSAEEHKNMSINDKSDLFFTDYSIMPLFVQENFLNVSPHCPKKETLDRLSQAAESLSHGDIVEARIRRSQAWNLLPTQAIFSSVIPGHVLSGHMAGQIQFPSWLGKNSRSNKMHRLCQEIHAHTRLSTSGSKSSIFLDYSTHLRDAITNPLIKDKTDGIEESLKVLESYHLLREDLDSLVELSIWPGQRNPTALIDAKVKAAMTRTYNKKASALPYAAASIKKGRATEDGEMSNEEESSDVELDAMIKKKKKEPAKPSASKGKGKQEESTSTNKGPAKKKPVPKQKKK